jgi:glutamate-1-semialdehyde aminotransferase
MAADKLVFEVQVTQKGVKIVQKDVDALGVSVDRTAKKTKDAKRAQDEYNYSLNQGVTGVSSAARSFSKLSQAIGNGPNGLVGAYATLAANAFAVSAAFNVLRDASQAQQVMKGLEVQGARLGYTLTNTAKSIQEISRGSLSMAESMQLLLRA